MASFMANLLDRANTAVSRPETPTKNNFLTPTSTPQGSPSKKTLPPGAYEVGTAQDNSGMASGPKQSNIIVPIPSLFDNAVRLGRPQTSGAGSASNNTNTPTTGSSQPLSPSKGNSLQPHQQLLEDPFAIDDSVVHKKSAVSPANKENKAVGSKGETHVGVTSSASPALATVDAGAGAGADASSEHKGKENLQPSTRLPVPTDAASQQQQQQQQLHQGHAAATRHELYQQPTRERPNTPNVKKFNTSRGLTPEELEILKRPNVRRLVNVTQLYFLDYYFDLLTYVGSRQGRLNAFKSEIPAPPETDEATYHQMWHKYTGRERANLRKRRIRLRHGDFQILTQVGQGGYGQVFLAQKKDTREVCALKVMSKKLLFKLDEVRHVLTERDILTTAKSEWLVRLLYSFQDEASIYLAMEYVPGGDFRTLLNNTGVLSNRHARFYIAEMFCAVDALHQLGYIHRDLKPENFLVDSTGHVKLTDFGLAAGFLAPAKIESMRVRLEQASETSVPFGKPMEQRTMAERREGYRTMRDKDTNYAKSIVGSPDYMAPEVLRGEEYDFTVDYWSLGCMLFEALTGFPPFAGATPDETWRNLKHWRDVLKRPVWEDPNYFLSNRTWNFITTCINARSKRFSRIDDIYQHHYFSEVEWETLRSSKAPFVPELDSETDAGYFDDFTNEADMAKYKEVHDKQTALESMADREESMGKGLFVGFTFRHRKTGPATADEGEKPGGGGGGSSSPRKPLTNDTFGVPLDTGAAETYGTMLTSTKTKTSSASAGTVAATTRPVSQFYLQNYLHPGGTSYASAPGAFPGHLAFPNDYVQQGQQGPQRHHEKQQQKQQQEHQTWSSGAMQDPWGVADNARPSLAKDVSSVMGKSSNPRKGP
ncbi:cell cycle protein kinase DBF2 [Sporothrix brasiliensis 5110]|uniref:non-specific serine/threonine protein kinase n=1 Tax=Sporothrix brasiliensis 5110 TaxID=1398154 RepID=A0A0C2IQK7_9PEZI|nr:cell cycle protein kinase DBF2 [Sporothrix brasiliensis 5110]KIH87342.1 cell cycle protein kinase DBF2 [Sporothrix brasiliensis 5110]